MNSIIVGVGVDAVSVARWTKVMDRTPAMESFVFTDAERALASSTVLPERALAGRFAAKEACQKALSAIIPWKDIEVLEDSEGSPTLIVEGHRDLRTHVSIAQHGAVAVAVVVIEDTGE